MEVQTKQHVCHQTANILVGTRNHRLI